MHEPGDRAHILFAGTGVIGSIYAAKLALAGHRVTVLARGKRLEDIRAHGLMLKDALQGDKHVAAVDTIETIAPDVAYDLIVAAVRNDQIDALLPALTGNRSPHILFMVNNPLGYDTWIGAVGKDRILVGFPGAGGQLTGPTVEYTVVSRVLQPTTIGEIDGAIAPRTRRVAALFRNAGFPVALCPHMDFWQKSHVAWVTPCAFAIYHALAHGLPLAESPESVRLMVRGIREGFHALQSMRIPITPTKLKILEILPERMLISAFLLWARTRHFDVVAARHSLSARSEMEVLARQFLRLIQGTPVHTPALTNLYAGIMD